MQKIKVSIICLVYNHENYLRDCLEGFVSQQCNFEYEALIHDDASTDSSASIIREYEEKYPNIIKPIYQKENQYSKGISIVKTYLFPKARGEYLAWCEGDDSWTDPHKLQKQVDFLDKNPGYSACVHCTTVRNLSNGQDTIVPQITEGRGFSFDEIVEKGGDIFSTDSLMMRAQVCFQMPDCFKAKGFGDLQLYMYSALSGGIWCLPDNMAMYNCGVAGSWTDRIWNNEQKRIAFLKELIRMLNAVNEHYEYKYNDCIEHKINESEFQIHVATNNKKQMKNPKYKYFYKGYKHTIWAKRLPFLKKIRDLFRRKKEN